jgi:hypothetical protein
MYSWYNKAKGWVFRVADLGRIPGPIIIPNCIEVDLVWNLASGKQVKNVLHGQVAAGFNATAAIAQAVYAAIIASGQWAAWAAFLHTTASFQGVNLRDLRTSSMPLVSSTGAATPGTGAGSALPPGSAACVTLRTASAGRGFRGRVYLPGLDSGILTAATGAMTAGAQTAAQNFMTEVGTALTASAITLSIANPARQVYNGRKGALHPARAAAVINVTSNVVRLLALTSQRRRSYVA